MSRASTDTRDDVRSEIEQRTSLTVSSSMTGKKTTTYAIGGTYKYFVEPQTELELSTLVKILAANNQKFRVLGAGSNLLVDDDGLDDWVIRLGKGLRKYEKIEGNSFWVQGAMPLMTLSRELSELGYSGLEFAGGIPASVGGAVRMNAGAHGGEMSEVLERIRFVTLDGSIEEVSRESVTFSYRRSEFGSGVVVTGAQIVLVPSDPEKVRETRAHYLAERKKRQPLSSPSAGSVFKNPPGTLSAGALIEQCGLKGYSVGGAVVSELHGNWIVNPTKSACSSDVDAVVKQCQQRVLDRFGIELEPEVITWR